jgi:hypothetical protein
MKEVSIIQYTNGEFIVWVGGIANPCKNFDAALVHVKMLFNIPETVDSK